MEPNNTAPAATPNGSTPSVAPQGPVTPAVDPSAAPGSQPAPAQGTSTAPVPSNSFSFETAVDDDAKKYLQSQGINSFDQDGLKALIDAHKSLRAKKDTPAQTPQDVLNAIANPNAAPVVPEPQAQPVTQPTVQPQQPAQGQSAQADIPSNVEIFNTTNSLVGIFPAIADQIKSGQLYQEMSKMGISPVVNGHFNIDAVMTYANVVNNNAVMQQKIAQLENPAPQQVVAPNATPVDTSQPQATEMNRTAAENIVLFSLNAERTGQPVHSQYEQAKAFLRTAK